MMLAFEVLDNYESAQEALDVHLFLYASSGATQKQEQATI